MVIEGWQRHEVKDGDQLVAVLHSKGTEVHWEVTPNHRRTYRATRAGVKLIAKLFAQYGFLTTRVWHTRYEQQKFVEKFGFERTWADEKCAYYMLTHVPLVRKP